MARQKKTVFTWNGQRLKAAKLMAEGFKSQEEVAKECQVSRQTVNAWCQQQEFNEKVTELVLLDERATKAGILKRALTTLEEKSKNAPNDKSTELDYLKFISDFQGHTKHTVKHEGGANINVMFYLPGNNRDPEINVTEVEYGEESDD